MLRGLSAVLIVTLLTGCDNVDWGGAEITIVPPPPHASADRSGDAAADDRLPEGPVLYHVRLDDTRGTLTPVAELMRDSLREIAPTSDAGRYGRRFIAEHLRRGREFTLFRRGHRVGTFVVDSAALSDESACPKVPAATGTPELIAGTEATDFLALAKPAAPATRSAPAPPQPVRRMSTVAPILAERALRARDAPLPGSWTQALAQLDLLPAPEGDDPAIAATFLVGDTLGPGLDDEGASVLIIAERVPEVGYDTAYVDFTDYQREGKAAPQVIDYLDWDRDGTAEVLLRVHGTNTQWYEAIGRADGQWSPLYRSRCRRTRARPAPAPDTGRAAPETTARGLLPEPRVDLSVPLELRTPLSPAP